MNKERTTEQIVPHVIDIVIPAYNARETIQNSVKATLFQELPANWKKNVIIIDDGSSDDTAPFCESIFEGRVQVISSKQNRGRSSSRNTGWRSGTGQYTVFLDADCEWNTTGSLAAHLKVLEAGADVSTGAIFAHGQDFWAAYQNNLQMVREHDFNSGNLAAFTSANFAIRRSILEAIGGFDEGYGHYGFEDRDFFLRLIAFGANVSFCPDASVIHTLDSSLKSICWKMMDSGEHSSLRFQMAHTEYYVRTMYGKIDCRLHGFPLTLIGAFFNDLIPGLARLGDNVINISGVPFKIKLMLVKLISGIAYLTGTYRGYRGK